MQQQLLDFSISQDLISLTNSRNNHYQHIMCSIISNSITLLAFIVVQGYILRKHQDWDSITVLIIACITIILEGLSLLQVFHMQTLKLVFTTSFIVILETLILAISIFQTTTEQFLEDSTFEIIIQIIAIILFFIIAIYKLVLAIKLKKVFEQTISTNHIREGIKNKESYEQFSKSLK